MTIIINLSNHSIDFLAIHTPVLHTSARLDYVNTLTVLAKALFKVKVVRGSQSISLVAAVFTAKRYTKCPVLHGMLMTHGYTSRDVVILLESIGKKVFRWRNLICVSEQ